MKNVLLFILVVCISCSSPDTDHEKIKQEIQIILNEQTNAWNAGSIEGFMDYYWHSEEFTFQTGNQRVQGWDALFARYQNNYSGENQGKLRFTDLKINVLSNEHAYVLGRWNVTLEDTSKQGLFTIIFKQFPEGWRIINDHTS